jgi:galactose mutarotase-like enzyme
MIAALTGRGNHHAVRSPAKLPFIAISFRKLRLRPRDENSGQDRDASERLHERDGLAEDRPTERYGQQPLPSRMADPGHSEQRREPLYGARQNCRLGDDGDNEENRRRNERRLEGEERGGHRLPRRLNGEEVEAVEDAGCDAGFPGALTATCVYRLVEPATLRIELSAVSDRPTIVNLTNHTYFNLDGSPDILDHEVTLFADFYTPADAELIPTGEIRAVAGTPYDFRNPRTVRNPTGTAYDTNFVAALEPDEEGLAQIAAVRSPRNGLTMSLFSTEPGVQFYDAATLNCPAPGLNGEHYGAHAGSASRRKPSDSRNRRHFTDCVLTPEDEYQHVTEFRFA